MVRANVRQFGNRVVEHGLAGFGAFIGKSPRLFLLIALPVAAIYYAGLITHGRFDLVRTVVDVSPTRSLTGLTFNSMLEHLLRGQFDVDPHAIGSEAFVYAGRSYAYFGIFTALLRLPLLIVGRLHDLDITSLSCVTASVAAVFFKLATMNAVNRVARPSHLQATLVAALAVAIVFSGFEVEFLRPVIYQEVVSWAGALATAFVYFAVRGLVVEGGFSRRVLVTMAVIAGLELMTRVSTAIGLYGAMSALFVSLTWREARTEAGKVTVAGWVRAACTRRMMLPAAILFGFGVLLGLINYCRFGDPLTIMDLHMQVYQIARSPDRIGRLDTYGGLNVGRLWYGLLYYFVPLWAIVLPDHRFLFQDFSSRMFDMVEAPPSSFLLTDPLLVLLAIMAVAVLSRGTRRCPFARGDAAALLVGLSLPALLVSVAISLAFRYRIEFVPAMELAAFLGFHAVASEPSRFPRLNGRHGSMLLLVLALWSVMAAHVMLLLYRHSDFGPATAAKMGWLRYYYWRILSR
jgi:hypothetical protein